MKRFCIIAALLSGAGVSTSFAQTSQNSAIDATIACRAIEDQADRLACFDTAAEALAKAQILADATEPAAVASAPTSGGDTPQQEVANITIDPVDEFGSEALRGKKRAEYEKDKLKSVSAEIVEIQLTRKGKVIATLDNGQKWRQLDADSTRIIVSNRPKKYTATIKRGFVGSYFMRINELKKSVRARRIE